MGLKENLKEGFTLPGYWYTDPAIFQLEKENIFKHTWNYAGRIDQIPNPGDYFSCRVGSLPVVILRDEQKMIKAYVNVCRHRGAEIIPDQTQGNRKTLQCHYHSWTYGFDGCLLSAPRSEGEVGFKKENFPLTPLQVDTLGSLIFVNSDPKAPSWPETLGQLPEILKANGTELHGLPLRGRKVYSLKCNWKVAVENYLECYHCPSAHKGFSSLINLNEYQITPYRYISVQRGPVKEGAQSAVGSKEGIYTYVWPGFMLNTYPGLGNASANMIIPVDEQNTLAVFEFYLDPQIPETEAQKTIAFIDQVQNEDTILCESVQRGLNSGAFEQGRLILNQEKGIQHFQELVYSTLFEKEKSE